jgi:hypothetical protein
MKNRNNKSLLDLLKAIVSQIFYKLKERLLTEISAMSRSVDNVIDFDVLGVGDTEEFES